MAVTELQLGEFLNFSQHTTGLYVLN